jgi:uncharacterized membrane protein YtjA (UPF0391 family)
LECLTREDGVSLFCVSERYDLAEEGKMLRWALAFFIIAIIAAIFGFAGIAVAAAGIAKVLFFIFLVLFVIALLSGLARRA